MGESNVNDLEKRNKERHLLVAVDGSDNSKRAVAYLADFFANDKDVDITVLSIIPEPSEDYFATDDDRLKWIAEKQAEIETTLTEYNEILLSAGIGEEQLQTRLITRHCESIGDAILEEQEKLNCCIVVVGRRGLSHNEEFIFGSTSNRILHRAKNCAVMVVE